MSRDYVIEPFRPEINLQIDYARELNPQQLAAVTAPPGPALVIAGAGSGKTRTLTYRVAYLLEQGIPADRILLLTFTNKAAGEMMHRVAGLLGRQLPSLWGGTFHSIGARILRVLSDLILLEDHHVAKVKALAKMQQCPGRYDPNVLNFVAAAFDVFVPAPSKETAAGRPVLFKDLRAGQVLMSDVLTRDGMKIIMAGAPVTSVLLAKLRNFAALSGIQEPILVAG